jgi:hypothetical protein
MNGAGADASPAGGETLTHFTATCGVACNVSLNAPIALGEREVVVDACALQGTCPPYGQLACALTQALSAGLRPYMEDRFGVAQERAGAPLVAGVFDGHGGFKVAQALAERLPLALLHALSRESGSSDAQIAATISRCFLEADAEAVRDDIERTPHAPGPGSTAAVAILYNNALWMCNVGDARCVLADETGAVIAETADQTPSVPEERARLLMRGGTVSSHVYDRKPRACGVLAISRGACPQTGIVARLRVLTSAFCSFCVRSLRKQRAQAVHHCGSRGAARAAAALRLLAAHRLRRPV